MPDTRIAILDNHQSIIDGYLYRLSPNRDIRVVATGLYGETLEPLLANYEVDVLMLGLNLPVSCENPNPFPVIHVLPLLLQKYENLKTIIISMFSQASLIKALVETGINGYILKSDSDSIQQITHIVRIIASGGCYFSPGIYAENTAYIALLTPHQLEVITLCAAYPDMPTQDMAKRLGVSNSTVRNLLSGAYRRLGRRTRAAAIARAQQLGIVPVSVYPDPKISDTDDDS